MKRRVWAFILSLAMLITLCPASVFAVEAEEIQTVVAEETVEEAASFEGLSEVEVSGEMTIEAARAGASKDMGGLVFKGVDENATLIIEGNGGGLSNVHFENLTVVDNTFYTYENGENAWEFTYLEFEGTCTFKNVTFTDGVMFEGDITATDCTFVGHNNDSSEHGNTTMYGAWVHNGTSVFEDCIFTGTRGLKVHEAYGSDVTSVTVKDCTFDNLTEKPGVAIDKLDPTTVVILENCVFNNCKDYETKTTGYIFKIVKVAEVATAAELQEAIAATNPVLEGDYKINITADIDLAELGDVEWVSGKLNGYNGAGVYTVNGNGHTIKNLPAPLFEGTWAGKGELYINDLTIVDSEIVGGGASSGCGAFVAHSEATKMVQLKNCHLVNSSVTGKGWTGGFIGFAAGYNKQDDGPVFQSVVLDGCSVENSDITGANATGGFFGHATANAWTDVVITNCEVKDNTITCTDDSNIKAGAVVGTVGVGTVHVDANVSGNTAISNGVEVNRIFGRIGSSGGVLEITGGSYDYSKKAHETKPVGDGADPYTIKVSKAAKFSYKVDVATAEELVEALAATNPVLEGDYTINIVADIDLTDVTLTSGYLNGYQGAGVYTVNGNGHKITNLTTPLFSGTWAGKGELYINDLTIADSGIVGGKDSVGCGAFVGNASATKMIQLKNCHLVDSSVLGADWTGGLIGYAAGYSNQNDGPVFEYVVMDGCSVQNCTIIGAGSTGAVIGHATGDKWTDVTINNCVVKNNIVKCTDDSNVKAGAVIGTVGVGTVHVNATVSGNSVTSNGNAVNRIFGRIGSNGGVLDITGGSYSDYWKEDTTKAPEGDSAKEYTITVAAGTTFKVVVPPTPVTPSEPEETPDEPETTPVTTPTQPTTTTPVVIEDEETPLAGGEEVEIEDEETPLASGEIKVEVVVKEEVAAKAEEQVNTLVEQILAGETVEETVVSEETVAKIVEAIENGEEIVAKVVAETIDEKEIPAEAKEAVKEAIASMVEPEVTNVVVAQFLDLSVAICTGSGEELGTYNELTETLTFTVAIPDDMETEGKTFVVIRVHNGEVTILDTVMNEDGTLSFETDRFSTYALAYKEDVVKETVEDTEVADKEIVDEETPLVESNNGNFFPGILLVVVVVIVAAVGVVLIKKSFAKAE